MSVIAETNEALLTKIKALCGDYLREVDTQGNGMTVQSAV